MRRNETSPAHGPVRRPNEHARNNGPSVPQHKRWQVRCQNGNEKLMNFSKSSILPRRFRLESYLPWQSGSLRPAGPQAQSLGAVGQCFGPPPGRRKCLPEPDVRRGVVGQGFLNFEEMGGGLVKFA